MNTIRAKSRTSHATLAVLLCALSVFMQSVAMPLHAASHAAPASAASVDHAQPGHSHDPAPTSDGTCATCHLLSQTADGQSIAPPEVADLLQFQAYLRGPRPRAMPTRLALNDQAPPRAPPRSV